MGLFVIMVIFPSVRPSGLDLGPSTLDPKAEPKRAKELVGTRSVMEKRFGRARQKSSGRTKSERH
jgi:hypothetical protein